MLRVVYPAGKKHVNRARGKFSPDYQKTAAKPPRWVVGRRLDVACMRGRAGGDDSKIAWRQLGMYTVCMEGLQFAWDENKNLANRRKHGVSFEEAQTAFFDERAKVFFDPDHSEDEDRFILLGVSFRLRTLVVCHCYRENDTLVRIISARKADRREQEDYGS
jgi:uncharacterized protein